MQFIWGIFITLVTGLLIEFLHIEFSRFPEIGELWRYVLGCLIGLTFFSPAMKKLSKKWQRLSKTVVILLLIFELSTPAKNILDEMIAAEQYPLLSGFETPFEQDRWEADVNIKRVKTHVYAGNYAARVSLNTDRYSAVSLRYFPRDWLGFEVLQFAVYNPNSQEMAIFCRVHDRKHLENNQQVHDRYNKRLLLVPGWNLIIIPLDEIENAPRGRKMNLANIYNFMLFSNNLSENTWICLDELRLQ